MSVETGSAISVLANFHGKKVGWSYRLEFVFFTLASVSVDLICTLSYGPYRSGYGTTSGDTGDS